MEKVKSYFIQILDNGFIVQEGSKKRAVEKTQTVEEILTDSIKEMISALRKVGTQNVVVSISVEENVPTIKPE